MSQHTSQGWMNEVLWTSAVLLAGGFGFLVAFITDSAIVGAVLTIAAIGTVALVHHITRGDPNDG